MKYTAESIWIAPEPSSARITDVVVTDTKLSIDFVEGGETGHIDFVEGGETGHLEAISTDRVHYVGNYGYTAPADHYEYGCTRFDAANGEILLYGQYRDRLEGEEGYWLIRLRAEHKKPATARK